MSLLFTMNGYEDFKAMCGAEGSPLYVQYCCGFGGGAANVKAAVAVFPNDHVVRIILSTLVPETDFIVDFPIFVKTTNSVVVA